MLLPQRSQGSTLKNHMLLIANGATVASQTHPVSPVYMAREEKNFTSFGQQKCIIALVILYICETSNHTCSQEFQAHVRSHAANCTCSHEFERTCIHVLTDLC